MTTMNLRALLDGLADDRQPSAGEWAKARRELRAIERAARDVLDEDTQSPDNAKAQAAMKRYHAACELFERITKQEKW